MTKFAQKFFVWLFLFSFFVISASCTVTTRTVSPDEELTYDETYTFADKKKIGGAE